MKTLARRAIYWLLSFVDRPDPLDLVLALTLQTAALELPKGEWMELAPIKGCCGPFRLTGNSLPVFEYIVFEKAIMEFVKVRVEVSRPDEIRFIAKIDSTTAPERHGEEVEVKAKYRKPFEELSMHLFRYFPLYRRDWNLSKAGSA